MRRMGQTIAFVLLVAGCTSTHKAAPQPTTTTLNPHDRATAACRDSAPGQLVNAQATTAGAIHDIRGGRDAQARGYAWILKDSPDDSFAAWCWQLVGKNRFEGYVVGPAAELIDTGQGATGIDPPGPGPMPPS